MSIGQNPSTHSKSKSSPVFGKDVPHMTGRPGGYVNIEVMQEMIKTMPIAASTPKESESTYACICKSPNCGKPNSNIPEIKVTPPSNESIANMKSYSASPGETTREYRINQALIADWDGGSLNRAFTADEDEISVEEPIPSANLLALTISTIMLLASGNAVPDNVLSAVVSYLKCVKDDENKLPPNVQGVLNHIALLREGASPKAGENAEGEPAEEANAAE